MSDNQQDTIEQAWLLPDDAAAQSDTGLLSHATAVRHATATILLHWGTVAAIVTAVACVYLRELTEVTLVRQVLLDVHRQLGLLVLIGVPLRIAARYWLGFSDQTATMRLPVRLAAAGSHLALYGALISLPLLGWAATNAKELSLSLFGLVPLPFIADPDPDLVDALLNYHKWGAWALGILVTLHVSAALGHHFIERDGVLAAMLPRRRQTVARRPQA